MGRGHTYLNKLTAESLSMYELSLPPDFKGLRHFPACYEFLDNFIDIWIKF